VGLTVCVALKNRQTKARDFEGPGGPEEKMRLREEVSGGDEDILSNVRQGGQREG